MEPNLQYFVFLSMTGTHRLLALITILSMIFCSCETQDDEGANNEDKEEQLDINSTPAHVGEFRQGGIVFHVNTQDSTTGLVVDVTDISASSAWGCYGTSIGGVAHANLTNLYGGAQNTKDIVFDCKFIDNAAYLCDQMVWQGYSDWYLPNSGEWNQIIAHLDTLESASVANGGKLFYDKYWTSNQPTGVVGETLAQAIDIREYHFTQESKNGRFAVRAVRAF